MAERPDQQRIEPEGLAGHEATPNAGPVPETCAPPAAYARLVNRVRIAVAIAMAVLGAGAVLCANRNELELTWEARCLNWKFKWNFPG